MANQPIQLSVVVMTYNEEKNLPRCLESVRSIADEMLVVDSFSKDRTAELAVELGAKVIQHPFANFRDQRRFCYENTQYNWVLALDADEWLSLDLAAEIAELKKYPQASAYILLRQNGIGGHWARYGDWKPEPKLRLFDRRQVQMGPSEAHDEIQVLPGQTIGHLKGAFFHLSNVDFTDRINSINRLSSLAAEQQFRQGKKTNGLKIGFKPAFRFFKAYVLQGGFLDGRLGWFLAKTSAQYVFLREMKLWEKLHKPG
jgi:glycosyltransferase involved in cell wall biosynthesis